jgi:hypothetical protein
LRSTLAVAGDASGLATRIVAVRAEALRLLVLNDDGRANQALDEALAEDPDLFGGVVAWGRGRLTGN